jgi:hypothetical protein
MSWTCFPPKVLLVGQRFSLSWQQAFLTQVDQRSLGIDEIYPFSGIDPRPLSDLKSQTI